MYEDSTLSDAFPDVAKQDTERDVRELRATFKAGLTRDLDQRRELLGQLRTVLTEGEAVIQEAIWKDLRKHPNESFVNDIAPILLEIQDHLDFLEEWTAPEPAETNPANMPGESFINRDPLGVVCVIGTWNYPINLLFAPIVSALAAGNCVVARLPGDDTTRYLNNVLISLFDQHMDKRFFRYVYGGVDETKTMLQQKFDLIFATGGSFLGKIVARAAAETLTPAVLELGGKSSVIVDNTSDIQLAARRIAWGAFLNAGQTCIRPDYVLVDESIGDELVGAMEKRVEEFFGQQPKQSESFARVVNERAFQRLAAKVTADKARVTFGGELDASENYVAPTMFNFKTDLDAFNSSAVMADEIFGPLLPIFYYPTGKLQWAIDYVNEKETPLALYHFSTSTTNQAKVVAETSSGSTLVNDVIMHVTNNHLPFGGVGQSGMGAYHGKHGFDTFSHKKGVIYKNSDVDLPQRYAPYTPETDTFMRMILKAVPRKQLRSPKAAAGFGIKSLMSLLRK